MDGAVEDAPAAFAGIDGMGLGLDVAREVLQVGPALEPHDVIGAEALHQPVVPRNGRQDQRRRQRDVQEKADALRAAQRAQLGRQRDQVVVVHPDHVIGLEQRQQLAREHLVHAPVALDVAGVEVGQVQAVVEDRPEHAVGIADVEGVVILPGQVHRHQLDRSGLVRVQRRAFGGRAFDQLAAPAEPEAAAVVQDLAQRHRQAAGRGLARIGHAVGDDDEAAHGARVLRSPCPTAATGAPRH